MGFATLALPDRTSSASSPFASMESVPDLYLRITLANESASVGSDDATTMFVAFWNQAFRTLRKTIGSSSTSEVPKTRIVDFVSRSGSLD